MGWVGNQMYPPHKKPVGSISQVKHTAQSPYAADGKWSAHGTVLIIYWALLTCGTNYTFQTLPVLGREGMKWEGDQPYLLLPVETLSYNESGQQERK